MASSEETRIYPQTGISVSCNEENGNVPARKEAELNIYYRQMKQDDKRLIDCYVLLFFAAPKESFLLVVSLDIN